MIILINQYPPPSYTAVNSDLHSVWLVFQSDQIKSHLFSPYRADDVLDTAPHLCRLASVTVFMVTMTGGVATLMAVEEVPARLTQAHCRNGA